MNELLERQNSLVPNQLSCMWGLLQFFNFHQRLHIRKMMAYGRQGEGSHARRTKIPKPKLNVSSSNEDEFLDGESNFLMEDKVNTTNRPSGKARMRTLIARLYKKQNRKQKASPLASRRLLRTISIHHLECDDYVLPDELTSDSETSTVESKDFLGILELLKEDKELFHRNLADSNSNSGNRIQVRQGSSPEIGLGKSRSFPRSGLSGRRNGEQSAHKLKQRDHESKYQNADLPYVPNSIEDGSQARLSSTDVNIDIHKDRGTVRSRFKVLKQRIKDVIKESKKDQHRISMDGILHKIPYGRKVPEDLEKEKLRMWEESDSYRYEKNGPKFEIGSYKSFSVNHKYKTVKVQRSRSLTESIDQYSRLLESISLQESRRPPERLKSIREREKNYPKTFGRILSSPEFGSYTFSNGIIAEQPDQLVSSEVTAVVLSAAHATVEANDSTVLKTASSGLHTQDNTEPDVEAKPTGTKLEHQGLLDEAGKGGSYTDSSNFMEKGNSYVHPHDQEPRIEMDLHAKTEKPSPISVLDLHHIEELVSPVKYSVLKGPDLKPRWITFAEELEYVTNDVPNGVETIKPEFDYRKPVGFSDFSSLELQASKSVRSKEDEAEFNYVREIFNKSRLSGEGCYLEACDSLLDEPYHELDNARDEPDEISVNRQLLFDLINEVLQDIYRNYFSHFGSRARTKSMDNLALKEVWAKISWHLSLQRHQNPTLDFVVVRDFTRNDGWMNLHLDAEYTGVELEGLIFDDLLDEILYDFGY